MSDAFMRAASVAARPTRGPPGGSGDPALWTTYRQGPGLRPPPPRHAARFWRDNRDPTLTTVVLEDSAALSANRRPRVQQRVGRLEPAAPCRLPGWRTGGRVV